VLYTFESSRTISFTLSGLKLIILNLGFRIIYCLVFLPKTTCHFNNWEQPLGTRRGTPSKDMALFLISKLIVKWHAWFVGVAKKAVNFFGYRSSL